MTDVFRIPAFRYPEHFLWGSATAAFQIEGDNIWSDLWYDEQELLKRDPSAEVSGTACNSYRMYREDVGLLQELGHRAYRFGIEWARIEPEEGVFCEEAAEHYVQQLALLKESFARALTFTEVPGSRKKECGNYLEHDLQGALDECAAYLKVLEGLS